MQPSTSDESPGTRLIAGQSRLGPLESPPNGEESRLMSTRPLERRLADRRRCGARVTRGHKGRPDLTPRPREALWVTARLIDGDVLQVADGTVHFRPLCPTARWHQATPRQVVGQRRKTGPRGGSRPRGQAAPAPARASAREWDSERELLNSPGNNTPPSSDPNSRSSVAITSRAPAGSCSHRNAQRPPTAHASRVLAPRRLARGARISAQSPKRSRVA